jgi:hypothetical protein
MDASEKDKALLDLYEALSQLWNAVYQDKELYARYTEWCDTTGRPVDIEMITRTLPAQLRMSIIHGYNVIHATSQTVHTAKKALGGI